MMPKHGGVVVMMGAPLGAGGASHSTADAENCFKLPDGYVLPEDVKPGDEIDVTVHGRVSEDGKSVEVMSVDGYGDEPDSAPDDQTEGDEQPSNEDNSFGARWKSAIGDKMGKS